MDSKEFDRRLAEFRTFAAAVPASPKNLAPRVTAELSHGLSRTQAKRVLDAETAAVLNQRYGPAPKRKAKKAPKEPPAPKSDA